jgi:hypothetical protein
MKYIDVRLNSLLKNYIDGIPLDLCCELLGRKGGFIGYVHLKLQNKSIKKHNLDGHVKTTKVEIPKKNLLNMFDMIESQIKSLKLKNKYSEWDTYYDNTNYSDEAMMNKEKLLLDFCDYININSNDLVFDLGANDGKFSRTIYDKFNSCVISFDIDNNAVNRNYIINKKENKNILPLVLDLNNPSSSIGFSNSERSSFMDRGNSKLTLSLALIHHLAISNNLSFEMISNFFSKITKYLVIEFVPKEDSQVKVLLNSRRDIFDSYDIDNFRKVFLNDFKILKEEKIEGSCRTLFLMEVKNGR